MKSTHMQNIDTIENSGKQLSSDLEDAGYKLLRASADLDKATQALITYYPDLIILANKLPEVNGQHPYERIKQAADLYKYTHQRHTFLKHQHS